MMPEEGQDSFHGYNARLRGCVSVAWLSSMFHSQILSGPKCLCCIVVLHAPFHNLVMLFGSCLLYWEVCKGLVFHLRHLDEKNKLPSTREFSRISTMEQSLLNSMILSLVKWRPLIQAILDISRAHLEFYNSLYEER